MHLRIIGENLPGRTWCRDDGSPLEGVHVGVQVRRAPAQLVSAGADRAEWDVDVDVIDVDGQPDFRGPVVQGRRGARFVYLTWGNVDASGDFEMFRRAKLLLSEIPPDLVRPGIASRSMLVATVDLTGPDGGPRCARVDPPAIDWRLELL